MLKLVIKFLIYFTRGLFKSFLWFFHLHFNLQEAMRQTYQRALKAAADFGYQKESPE